MPGSRPKWSKSCTRFAEIFCRDATSTCRSRMADESSCAAPDPAASASATPVIAAATIPSSRSSTVKSSRCPQLPTTLPTLDEILLLEPGCSVDQAAERILATVQRHRRRPRFHPACRARGNEVLQHVRASAREWRNKDYQLVALRDLLTRARHRDNYHATPSLLPRCPVEPANE